MEKDEDAQLTSAAPELLEELKTMIDIIEKGAETFQDQEDLIKYAKTIIAKAEGVLYEDHSLLLVLLSAACSTADLNDFRRGLLLALREWRFDQFRI